ncbi:histidine kinase [Nostocales cyanobacterium HT-58-2]|nr:histidine kinase [Nostocales cyanobacterium HT-58-2]
MLHNFKLGTKFTLLLLLVFIIGSSISGFVLSDVLQKKAQAQITAKGLVLMQTINSVREYTDLDINPLLTANLKSQEFVPELIPAYAARKVFGYLHNNEEYTNLSYKEAVLNPTNIADRADSFETELVERFRREPDTKELSGFRHLFGTVFYSARPIVVKSQNCLRCHSSPEVAPQSMVTTYGKENGFGWKLNSIVGAQVVYVPADEVFQSAHQAFSSVMGIFLCIFSITIVLLNRLLKPTVLQPIQYLAKLSQKLGAGDIKQTDEVQAVETQKLAKVAIRADELGQLARVFQGMVREVLIREQRLRQQITQLRIEIDETRKSREVAEIIDSDYFQQLLQKAEEFRNKAKVQGDETVDESSSEIFRKTSE